MSCTLKKVLSVLLSVVLLSSFVQVGFGRIDVHATSKTSDEAMNWCASKLGILVGGGQCVDFIVAYYSFLGATSSGGDGKDYATNALPAGWTRTYQGVPQVGDILVYTGALHGHVAIYAGGTTSYHQNMGKKFGEPVTLKTNWPYYNKWYSSNEKGTKSYWGCIHPNFTDPIVYDDPIISEVDWENNGSNTHIRPVVWIANPETVSEVKFQMWSHYGDGAQNNINGYPSVPNGVNAWFYDINYSDFSCPYIECRCYVYGKNGHEPQIVALPRARNKNFIYSLDVNMVIDDQEYPSGQDGFTFDLWLDGVLWGDDRTDWSELHYYGTSYSIPADSIKCPPGYYYTGSTVSGIITDTTPIPLTFSQYKYTIDVNVFVEDENKYEDDNKYIEYRQGCDGFTFDVNVNNGQDTRSAVKDFWSPYLTYGTTYTISNIQCPDGYVYRGNDTISGTVTGNDTIKLYFDIIPYFLDFDVGHDEVRPNLYKPRQTSTVLDGIVYSYDKTSNVMTFNGTSSDNTRNLLDEYYFKPEANSMYKVTATVLSGTIAEGGSIVLKTCQNNNENLSGQGFSMNYNISGSGSTTWVFTPGMADEVSFLQTWLYSRGGYVLQCDNLKLQIKIEKLDTAPAAGSQNLYQPKQSSTTLSGISYAYDASTDVMTFNGSAPKGTRELLKQYAFKPDANSMYKVTATMLSGSIAEGGYIVIKVCQSDEQNLSETTSINIAESCSATWTFNSTMADEAALLQTYLYSRSAYPLQCDNVRLQIRIEKLTATDDGTAFSPNRIKFHEGNKKTLPTPTREGYVFDGWYDAKTGGTKHESASTVLPASDLTLYARWSTVNYVTFDVNDGFTRPNLYKPATSSKILDGVSYFYDMSTNVMHLHGTSSENTRELVDMYPFKPEANTSYRVTVTFLSDTVIENGYIVLKACQNNGESLSEQVFSNRAMSGSETWKFTSATASETAFLQTWLYSGKGQVLSCDNVELQIKIEKLTSGINYSTEYSPGIIGFRQGESLTLMDASSRYDYSFDGWYDSPTGGTKYESGSSAFPASNLTLYVHWLDIEKPCGWYESFTNNVATTQSVLLNLFDNEGLAGYYWGTSKTYTPGMDGYVAINDAPTDTKAEVEVSAPGEYYLIIKDAAGNISTPDSPELTAYQTTLNTNGGSVSPAYVITICMANFELPTPTRIGYIFDDWYCDPDFSETAEQTSGFYTPTENTTLYAHWSPISYCVSYDGNGATSGSTQTSKHLFGEAKPLTANGFTRVYSVTFNYQCSEMPNTGKAYAYSFAGWKRDPNGSSVDYTNEQSVINLTSINGYTCKMYAHWIPFGSIQFPTPTRKGYSFGGWYKEPECTTYYGSGGTSFVPTENCTLYAKWTANTYTIQFNANGATSGSMRDQTFTYDVAQYLSANAFARKYTVTYNYNGATGGNSASTATATAAFNGWATSASGAKVYNNKQSVKNLATNGTVNLYANWTLGTITLPTPTKNGYAFGGWYTDSALTASAGAAGESFTPTANVTLYAQWTAIGYTITLDPNGGVCGIPAITAYYDRVYGVLPAATRSGFTFDGWFTADGTPVTETTVCTTATDHTLYAQWTAKPAELTVKEGSTAVLDRERGLLYGLDFDLTETALREQYLDVSGGGYLECSSFSVGTGTVVRLLDSETGDEIESFTVVIFGDITGDGALNSSDVTALRNIGAHMTEYEDGSPFLLAADVTHDGMVNSSDVTLIRSVNARLSEIDQTA